MRVRVYKNLHNRKWSILHFVRGKGWRLWKHSSYLWLSSVKMVVMPGGHARAVRENRRNVHAFIEGKFLGEEMSYDWRPDSNLDDASTFYPLHYNHSEGDKFWLNEDGNWYNIESAPYVLLASDAFAYYPRLELEMEGF